MSKPVHQEIVLSASPEAVYLALMNSDKHAAFTEAPADIEAREGGACSWYGGKITGRNIELVPNKRIVQAWRAGNWDEGTYSVVKYELIPDGGGTQVVLDQTGHPDGTGEHLDSGWHERYWNPLRKYLERQRS